MSGSGDIEFGLLSLNGWQGLDATVEARWRH